MCRQGIGAEIDKLDPQLASQVSSLLTHTGHVLEVKLTFEW